MVSQPEPAIFAEVSPQGSLDAQRRQRSAWGGLTAGCSAPGLYPEDELKQKIELSGLKKKDITLWVRDRLGRTYSNYSNSQVELTCHPKGAQTAVRRKVNIKHLAVQLSMHKKEGKHFSWAAVVSKLAKLSSQDTIPCLPGVDVNAVKEACIQEISAKLQDQDKTWKLSELLECLTRRPSETCPKALFGPRLHSEDLADQILEADLVGKRTKRPLQASSLLGQTETLQRQVPACDIAEILNAPLRLLAKYKSEMQLSWEAPPNMDELVRVARQQALQSTSPAAASQQQQEPCPADATPQRTPQWVRDSTPGAHTRQPLHVLRLNLQEGSNEESGNMPGQWPSGAQRPAAPPTRTVPMDENSSMLANSQHGQQVALPAAHSNRQHGSDRELLEQVQAALETQQGTLQLLNLTMHSLLSTTAAHLHELSAKRTHQLTQAAPQVVEGASVLSHSAAHGVSTQPATKAAQLTLKRSQQWERRSLHRKHVQQNAQAAGQHAFDANAAHTGGNADTTTAASAAPAVSSHPTAVGPHRPPDAGDPDADGPSAAASSPAAPSGVPGLTQAQPSSPGFCPSTSLASGIKVPGTDAPPWQDLKWAAFVTIGDYRSVNDIMDDWDLGILLDVRSGMRTHSFWALEHRMHSMHPRPEPWRCGATMTKAMYTRKPIIYHVLRIQREGKMSRAAAIKTVEALRTELAPRGKKQLSLPQLSNHLAKTEQSTMAFQRATWGWQDDTFRNTGGINPVRCGKRKAPGPEQDP
ncbi:hypothetical protein WJX74_007208 [Apatococcus lobatus]|uniref:Uncharacterized protein n=1 Tax=Apatococcus lobatus TaxID=904363 RepID=A0AAW1S723_9CHLO